LNKSLKIIVYNLDDLKIDRSRIYDVENMIMEKEWKRMKK
jgi:hypothetical protein